MRVAAVQFHPQFLAKERNLLRLCEIVETIEADLIVLPELCLSGYYFSSIDQIASIAHSSDDESFERFTALAMKKNCAIVFGFAEKSEERFYNSAACITPEGVQGIYRKTHLFAEEKKWFTPGDSGFFTFRHQDARIGVLICFDWRFPEAARSLALLGADVICHPSNLVSREFLWSTAMKAHAIENRVYVAIANRIGTESNGDKSLTFAGCSQIISCDGEILAACDATEERVIIAEIDIAESRRKDISEWNNVLTDRRPEMYLR